MKNKIKNIAPYILAIYLVTFGIASAGTLTPSVNTSTSNFVTLSDLYNKITNNLFSASSHSVSTTSAPASSMHTLLEIWNSIPNIISSTILSGTNIMGIAGTYNITNLTPAKVLSGTTYGTSSTGSLPTKVGSATIFTPSTGDQAITQGYYGGVVGDGKVSGDANLIASNIATGTSIFGIAGTAITSLGNALAANVLTGKTFSNATTANISGSMTNNSGHANFTPAVSSVSIPTGFYDGVTNVAGDANLITGNIKNGITIFGVSGKTSVVDTGDANAGVGDIVASQTAYVNGTKITGTIPVKTSDNPATTTATSTNKLMLTVPTGYYSGSATVSTTSVNFTAGNIASGVNLFGVTGTLAGAPAATEWYASDASSSMITWAVGSSTCAGLSTAGGAKPGVAWRLPTYQELVSLYLASNGTPAGFQSGSYWSGTVYPYNSSYAYYVYMGNGHADNDGKTYSYYVRCAR